MYLYMYKCIYAHVRHAMAGCGRFIFSVDLGNFLCVRNYLLNFCQNLTKNAYTIKDLLALKPKRPMNPFLLYARSVKLKLMQENPKAKPKELIMKISKEWANLEAIQKEKFQKQYTLEYATYIQRLKEFEDSLSTEQKELLQNRNQSLKRKIITMTDKEKVEKFGKPRRPLNAFLLYIVSKQKEKDPNINQKSWVREMSTIWKNMSDAEKEEYIFEARELKTRYKHDLEEWQRSMVNSSHLGTVRHNTLPQEGCSEGKQEN